ncbi:MAG: phosphatidylserine decarboxylase family protein [Paludibacteraceae bacterium]|nr:phosphatidylserine decarboxylase family protein [Paludibacteraceae bacterium]
MTIHKEGKGMLLTLLVMIALVITASYVYFGTNAASIAISCLSIGVFLFFLNFFRNPNRVFEGFEDGMIIAPADGTVVIAEPAEEPFFFKDKRIQVSIFMSVLNVHANWYPTRGKVVYYTHNDGRFMAANLPKSSTENERSTIVIELENKTQVLLRQVAGALARRIVTYSREGDTCDENQQLGFIKFGSRVDLYLPMDSEILVKVGDKTTGNQTVIARVK